MTAFTIAEVLAFFGHGNRELDDKCPSVDIERLNVQLKFSQVLARVVEVAQEVAAHVHHLGERHRRTHRRRQLRPQLALEARHHH